MTSITESIPSYRHVLEKFITQSDGKQIISHQIESFNQFIEVDIPEIIQMANPITSFGSPEIPLAGPRSALATATGLSTSAANALMGSSADGNIATSKRVKHEYEVTLEFEKISIRKPTIFENNGTVHPMMPNDARLRNLTYAAPLNVDIKVTTTFIDNTRNGIRESNVRIFPNVHLGKIPVMVGSKYCLLNDQKHVHPSKLGECPEDVGGYFIIQGGERAMISMERMSENRPFVFRNGRGNVKDKEVVEIKCIGPDNDQVPKSNSVKIVYHPKNQLLTMLRVTVPRIKTEIPLFILFRALGVLADKDICELIIGYDNDSTYDSLLNESILEASSINSQEQALAWLSEHTNTWSIKSQKQNNIQDIINDELFPQIGGGEMNYEKACFLAHITRKVLWTSCNRIPTDDRDAYPNKRVDVPGFLLADLFRKTYNNRMVKDMKSALSKEIHGGSWKATGNWTEIVNINNINKIIKSTILDVCLKSSLATGNFGSGKIGGPSKIGVSQVLNRMNHFAAISHLRRISTPIEKTGKLIAPRKQHNTQYSFICPCETPEGHGVGVIKNMATTTGITIFSSPITVYAFIQNMNKLVSLKDATLKQKHDETRVFLNGSWIGILLNTDTTDVVDTLRKAKRAGKIHIYTGIVWKNAMKELWITTEAGRVIRPIYFAPALREIAQDKTGKLKQQILSIDDWNHLLLWQTPSGKNLFEYIDAGETEGIYIAMDYEKAVNDTSTTHCEIHPSVLLGTTASCIPFPDHNQSPRNAYQCLWENETVLMSDGTNKYIKDVQVGEKVISFDPTTGKTQVASVINQYVRKTDKTIYKLTTCSGREIIATDNHPFITSDGWKSVGNILTSANKNIGIIPNWLFADKNVPERTVVLSKKQIYTHLKQSGLNNEEALHNISALEKYGLCPLYLDDTRLPQLTTLYAYYGYDKFSHPTDIDPFMNGIKCEFDSEEDATLFEQDIANFGIVNNTMRIYSDLNRIWTTTNKGPISYLIICLALSSFDVSEYDNYVYYIPDWIMNGSDNVKREFLGGVCGNKCSTLQFTSTQNDCVVICKDSQNEEYLHKICTLLKYFEIDATYSIHTGVILSNSSDNIIKFYDTIGYRYNNKKLIDSFKTVEYMKYVSRLYGEFTTNGLNFNSYSEFCNKITNNSHIVFVPIESIEEHSNVRIADITIDNNHHSFITSHNIGSHNSSMGKQAMGIYSLNFRERFDAMSHVLCYPEIPMVSPYMSKFYGAQTLPAGQNVVVAIMTYSGYNQEDSIMLNRASLERGRYRSIFYRTYKDEERKNQSSGEEEKFCTPNPIDTKHMKNANYTKVGEDGFVPKDQYVTPDDILIGKVVPLRVPTGAVLPAGAKKYRDVSKMPRNNESGFVDKIYKNRNGEGYNFVKIRMRQDRVPEIGDKFATRHAQKGTTGMILNAEDMPQTSTGIIPDLIMNPHAIPSRMTIGQLMETLLSKLGCMAGCLGDASPFNGTSIEDISKFLLDNYGMEPHGNEIMYNGYTGRMMETSIFIGPCYYQRLRHCSADKMHSRASGPLVMLTRQPAEGRAREGGLRFGEMERDCIVAHGMAEFTKERLMECSDAFSCYTCKGCGLLAIANPEQGIWVCRGCGNTTDFSHINIPYATKLLLQELETMNISSRMITQQKLLNMSGH